MNKFWNPEELDFADCINAEIWEESRSIQRTIQSPVSLIKAGAIGAQQAMIEGCSDCILPWVPDIVGARWRDKTALIVVGLAYAPFIAEYSGRSKGLPLDVYAHAESQKAFQTSFLRHVVVGDHSYYEKVVDRLPADLGAADIVLTDLCKVSFVRRGEHLGGRRTDTTKLNGTDIVRLYSDVFTQYAENRYMTEWTWRRLIATQANRVVALGLAAEHGLLRLFADRLIDPRIEHSTTGKQLCLRQCLGGTWAYSYASCYNVTYWETSGAYWRISGIDAASGSTRVWRMYTRRHPSRSRSTDTWNLPA